jgi:hypothetical protein
MKVQKLSIGSSEMQLVPGPNISWEKFQPQLSNKVEAMIGIAMMQDDIFDWNRRHDTPDGYGK